MACRGVWWCWPGLWVVSGIKRAAMTAYVGSPYFFSNNHTKIRLTLGSLAHLVDSFTFDSHLLDTSLPIHKKQLATFQPCPLHPHRPEKDPWTTAESLA